MKDKGGGEEAAKINTNRRAYYLDSRMVILIIICTAAGIAIILSFIFFGMRIGSNLQAQSDIQKQAHLASDIRVASVHYNAMVFYYKPLTNLTLSAIADGEAASETNASGDNAASDAPTANPIQKNADGDDEAIEHPSTLLDAFGATGASYCVIDSRSKLDDLLLLLNKNKLNETDSDVDFEANSDFFAAGSVIAFSVEGDKLSELTIDSLSRDDSYNITINATIKKLAADQTNTGALALIKISNVQPTQVKLNLISE